MKFFFSLLCKNVHILFDHILECKSEKWWNLGASLWGVLMFSCYLLPEMPKEFRCWIWINSGIFETLICWLWSINGVRFSQFSLKQRSLLYNSVKCQEQQQKRSRGSLHCCWNKQAEDSRSASSQRRQSQAKEQKEPPPQSPLLSGEWWPGGSDRDGAAWLREIIFTEEPWRC